MENSQMSQTKPTKSFYTNAYLARLGIILSNISMVALIVSVSSFVSSLLALLIGILGILLIILSVGTIFVIIPNYWSRLMSFISGISSVLGVIIKIMPYVALVGVLTSIASIIILSLDKNRNHSGRITFSAIVCALIVLAFVVMLVKGV